MGNKEKLLLVLTVSDILVNKGLPALAKFINTLNDRDKVTIEDIKAVKGQLDSASYFE